MEGRLSCLWKRKQEEEAWFTECGEAFVLFDDATPHGHGMKFCCYCGGILRVKK